MTRAQLNKELLNLVSANDGLKLIEKFAAEKAARLSTVEKILGSKGLKSLNYATGLKAVDLNKKIFNDRFDLARLTELVSRSEKLDLFALNGKLSELTEAVTTSEKNLSDARKVLEKVKNPETAKAVTSATLALKLAQKPIAERASLLADYRELFA